MPDPFQDAKTIVAACTEQRMHQRQFTINDAIEEALWLRRTPDGVLSPDVAKRTIEALYASIERSRCFLNATRRGQEIFVLAQQDRAAPAAIAAWAATARSHGCQSEKVDSAFRTAQRWGAQSVDTTKWPD